eukprot:15432585-Alexandrium_andersonii.AAC.1
MASSCRAAAAAPNLDTEACFARPILRTLPCELKGRIASDLCRDVNLPGAEFATPMREPEAA